MPYNNTPITPSKDITGTVNLPLARVKKIISIDPDIGNCSNNGAFVITAATEMFLQYLVEQSYNIVKAERKPRRNIQYRDVANAVARVENLEFLADVVPKTSLWKEVKTKQAAAAADRPAGAAELANGQETLDGHIKGRVGGGVDEQVTNGGAAGDEEMEEDEVEGTVSPPEKVTGGDDVVMQGGA